MRNLKRILTGVALVVQGMMFSPAFAAYPEKPVRILVGFPAGQATDMVARLVAEKLSTELGQPFVVENRPGQGGSLALAQLAKASPDGYSLMLSATASLVTNPHLYKDVGYDTLRDFTPIGTLADLPLVMVAYPGAPFDTAEQMIAHARANPGKLNFSSSGNGTLSHLAMELIRQEQSIDLTHIPYSGSPRAMVDLAAGNVSVGLDTVAVTKPLVEAGRLKLLAVAMPQRLDVFPDAPTLSEGGVSKVVASAWLGMVFPKGAPAEVVETLNAALQKALADPAVKESLAAIGALTRPSASGEFDTLLKEEYERWGEVVRASGARVD